MATLIKQASARYPVGELVFFRSFFALVPVLAWVGWRGELVTVLPDWAPRREIVHAVFASRRGLLPAVRALLDFLAERFAELEPD